MFYCAVCCCLHHPAVNDISVSLGLSVECVNKRMNERILFVLCSQRVHIHAICNSLCLSVLLASSFLCSLGVCISQCGEYVVTGMHYISVLYATRFRPACPRGVSWSSSRSSSTNWSGLYCITCTRRNCGSWAHCVYLCLFVLVFLSCLSTVSSPVASHILNKSGICECESYLNWSFFPPLF